MPDGNEITAQAADGTIHVFPAGTDPSVIDGAMKKYVLGKAQTQANSYKTPPPPSTAAQVGRGSALGIARGVGIPETQHPIKDRVKDLATDAIDPQSIALRLTGLEPFMQGFQMLKGGAEDVQEVQKAVPTGDDPQHLKASTINAPLPKPGIDWESASHGIASLLTKAAMMKGIKEGATDPLGKQSLQGMGKEVMNEGASKIKVLNDLHAHAIETQKHIAGVADAVHQDAQQAMSSVSQAVDSSKPEGVFDKGEVSTRLKTAIGDTLSDTTQLPKSVQKLLPAEKAGTGPNIGGKVLDLSKPEDMTAYQKYKASGAFTPEEVVRYEGKSTGNMSFEDLKQARSDLGRQMQNLQGPAKSAASAAYKELSTMLREGARDAGQEPDWIDANARWKNYLDDFERSPIKKTLFGENASDIMDPLTGKSRTQVGQILQKYTPFGMDMTKVGQEISRYGMGGTVMKLSKPGKMDLLLARMSPSAVALRQIVPRIMRNPKIISAVAGEGFEPKNIPPSKIFPSQKIAAKASTKGNPIPQGNATPFKGGINASGVEASIKPASALSSINSLSSELDTMKTKLRNAGDAPAGEKAALQKQIDEYQQRLDELRGKK